MNTSALRSQTAEFVGDPDQTRYTAATYLSKLNRAQEQFALDAKCLWKDTSYSTTVGGATLDLPSDFMWEDGVLYNGSKLDPITRHELAKLTQGSDWTLTEGPPTHYLIDPEIAQQKIRLYPIPQEVKTVSMRYFPLPTALVNDADIPLNSTPLLVQFHLGICAYAAWLLLCGEQATTPVIVKKREMERLYAEHVAKATETFGNTVSAGWRIKGTSVWF